MDVTNERVASLVLDFSIYPRMAVNEHHQRRMAEAQRAGATFPPVRADRASRRVTDGFHRCGMLLRNFGDVAATDVEWRDYPDERAMFLDAVLCNAHHGLRISSFDEAHCVEVALRMGVAPEQLAEVLALTQRKFNEMRARRFATGPGGEPVVLKDSVRHLAGTTVNRQQIAGNARASGWSLRFHVDQIVNALENGLADLSEVGLVQRLHHLAHLLDAFEPEEQVG